MATIVRVLDLTAAQVSASRAAVLAAAVHTPHQTGTKGRRFSVAFPNFRTSRISGHPEFQDIPNFRTSRVTEIASPATCRYETQISNKFDDPVLAESP
jgi:hypothetical protein